MKIFMCFLGLLALGYSASIEPIAPIKGIIEKMNVQEMADEVLADASEFVDILLDNLRIEMIKLGLDRISLPNTTHGFEKKILGITWRGEFSLYKGFLQGVETIRRTGIADLAIDPNEDIIVTAELGVTDAKLGYSGHVTFMDLGPHLTVTGKLTRVKVLMVLRVKANMEVQLDKFDVKDTGFLTVDIKGLGAILNFLAEIMVDVIGNVVKPLVVWILEGTIKNIINDVLKNILFPPESFKAIQMVQSVIISQKLY